METEEAIETLQLMMGLKVPGETKAVGLAIEALRHRTGRKPVMKEVISEYGYDNSEYLCPACSGLVSFVGNFVKYPYCQHCGAGLDWSDVNDKRRGSI